MIHIKKSSSISKTNQRLVDDEHAKETSVLSMKKQSKLSTQEKRDKLRAYLKQAKQTLKHFDE